MLAHPLHEPLDLERLVHEVVGAGRLQLADLVLFDHAGDADDANVVHALVAADPLADFLAVDVREHDVQHDQVGPVLLDHHAGVEAVVDAADLEPAVAIQRVGDQFDQFVVVVDDQHLSFAAFQGVGGNAVVPHERKKLFAGNAAKPAARHAKPLELPRVETADNRLLGDLADLGRFAGCKHGFHVDVFTILVKRVPERIVQPPEFCLSHYRKPLHIPKLYANSRLIRLCRHCRTCQLAVIIAIFPYLSIRVIFPYLSLRVSLSQAPFQMDHQHRQVGRRDAADAGGLGQIGRAHAGQLLPRLGPQVRHRP